MDGNETRDMDDAWREYLTERERLKSELGAAGFGWNPRKVFEAGWNAGTVRASGWYSGRE
jgi:hypothetical protein